MSTLGESLNALRSGSPLSCDFSLEVLDNCEDSECESVTILVHGLILSARSPVFRAMLGSEMKEAERRVVRIEDSTPEAIETMVDFMYLNTALFSSIPHCMDVCIAARKYSVPGLTQQCEQYLISKLELESLPGTMEQCEFEGILNFAELFEMVQLENKCFAFLLKFVRISSWDYPTFLTIAQMHKYILFQHDRIESLTHKPSNPKPIILGSETLPTLADDHWLYQANGDY